MCSFLRRPCSSILMATHSSIFLPDPRPLSPFYPDPNSNFRHPIPPSFKFSVARASSQKNLTSSDPPPLPPSPDKKSFVVATGELFLGIASRIIKRGNGGEEKESNFEENSNNVRMFGAEEVTSFWRRKREKEGIAAVLEDREVVWEQRLKDVEAERRLKAVTSPGFSFSTAGLLFPYHLGVANCLIQKDYIKDTTPLAGSSAGAIVCAVIASGASMEEALKATKVLADDCRLKGTAFRLGGYKRMLGSQSHLFLSNCQITNAVLENFLPDDVHIRSNGRVRGRGFILVTELRFKDQGSKIKDHVMLPTCSVAVTQILWRPRGLLVDQFDSREDLINAVITSSFIPGYLAPRPATMFRNRLCVDGGLTLFMPPASAAQTIRVCAFPASCLGLQGIGISPDCNPDNRASPRELLNWALEPAEDLVLDKLFEQGYLDAAVWAEKNPIEDLVQDSPISENGVVQ